MRSPAEATAQHGRSAALERGERTRNAKEFRTRYVGLKEAGHYLAEERPDDIVRELTAFFA
ncbi:hypothetical protein ACWEJP_03570 [Streptomyces sp. NPDC004749]